MIDLRTFSALAFMMLALGEGMIMLVMILIDIRRQRQIDALRAQVEGLGEQIDALGEMTGDHQVEWRKAHRELLATLKEKGKYVHSDHQG